MSRSDLTSQSLLLSLALAVAAHSVAIPEAASTAAMVEASLQAGTCNGATGIGAVDGERSLFVGMGGMRDLPSLQEIGRGSASTAGCVGGTGVVSFRRFGRSSSCPQRRVKPRRCHAS
jgi:hypothetical protein